MLGLIAASAQSAPSGLNVIPTVDTYEPGMTSLEYQMDGEHRWFGSGCGRSMLTQFGFGAKAEVGFDHCMSEGGETAFNVKYRFLERTAARPAFALGIQNVRRHANAQPYLVAGQNIGAVLRGHAGMIDLEGRARAMLGADATWGSLTLQSDWVSGRENYATVGFSYALRPDMTVTCSLGRPNSGGGPTIHAINVQYIQKTSRVKIP
jgi:hypothetical protein